MQYIVSINQTKALEWGLNAQQAMLFAFLHQVPTWACARQIDGETWFNCSKGKIVDELPLLTDKQDTAYRLMKQVRDAGLINMTSCDNRTYIRLTAKALEWNRAGSEKSPTPHDGTGSEKSPTTGKKSEQGRKNIRAGSEKSPTYQDTNIKTPSLSGARSEHAIFETGRQLDDRVQASNDNARQHAMTLDWAPDHDALATECQRRGMPADTQHTAAELADFTAHFADSGKLNAAHGWVARFARWIHENRRREAARNQNTASKNAGGNHANRSAQNQRAPIGRLSPAEARAEYERQQRERQHVAGSGQVYDGDFQPGDAGNH